MMKILRVCFMLLSLVLTVGSIRNLLAPRPRPQPNAWAVSYYGDGIDFGSGPCSITTTGIEIKSKLPAGVISVTDLEVDMPGISSIADYAKVTPLSIITGYHRLILHDMDDHKSYDGDAVLQGLGTRNDQYLRSHQVSGHFFGAMDSYYAIPNTAPTAGAKIIQVK